MRSMLFIWLSESMTYLVLPKAAGRERLHRVEQIHGNGVGFAGARRSCFSNANRLLFRDAGPLEGLSPFGEREILDDLAITKHEAIGKSSANPFG
jgi:hypothetical protein